MRAPKDQICVSLSRSGFCGSLDVKKWLSIYRSHPRSLGSKGFVPGWSGEFRTD